MKKTIQYILMSVALAATASCSNEMDKALQPADNCTLKFIVGDFPTFCESGQTRTVGTADPGRANGNRGMKSSSFSTLQNSERNP